MEHHADQCEMIIPSRLEQVRAIEESILHVVRQHGFCDKECFAIKLALEEALANAIKHGNQGNPDKQVVVCYRVSNDMVKISVRDEGGGFEPRQIPDPTLDENLEKPCGRGLLLMRSYMSEVYYNPSGNCVTMIKRRQPKAEDKD